MPESWQDFIYQTSTLIKLCKHRIALLSRTEDNLNKAWNTLKQAIKQTADEIIPKTKISPKKYYAFSKKASQLHSALQKINTLIRTLQILGPESAYAKKTLH
ncbi:32265_t:CDS:1 [Gigaspora margarita]|uniref:32265_t:CDS:1 n=1 Tax=Gigaspora margarita TaxID=4874 RepID=A0ABN7UDW3_GIGMA|nr:32265_t:CDS:1 [Gigaspora margarita]